MLLRSGFELRQFRSGEHPSLSIFIGVNKTILIPGHFLLPPRLNSILAAFLHSSGLFLLHPPNLSLAVVQVINRTLMPILPCIIRRLLLVPIDQLHVGSELNKQLYDLKVSGASRIEEAGLAVSVLVVDIAACTEEGLAYPSVSVELCRIEERGLAEEVIIVEWKVEGQKVPDYFLFLVAACEVQDGLFVGILMPDIPALLDQIIQSLLAGLLVTDFNRPKEHIFPLMVDTHYEFPGSWIPNDGSTDVIAPILIDHLPQHLHHLFWLNHLYIISIHITSIIESSAVTRIVGGLRPAFASPLEEAIPTFFLCFCG